MRNLLTDPKFADAADHFAQSCAASRAHANLAAAALKEFGDHGAPISGCVRDHFPAARKQTLRNLARHVAECSDRAWKARPPRVRSATMRQLSRLVAQRDGSGFYGPQA